MNNESPAIAGGTVGSEYRSDRVQRLLRSLKKALELRHSRDISYRELGSYSGESASTAFDKLQRKHHPQIESLLAWLERLPVTTRSELLETALRSYPAIDHPRISHDPSQVSLLRRLVERMPNLTIVHGTSRGACTFVVSAIAHSYGVFKGDPDLVRGLDTNEPDWFVPLPRVTYLPGPCDPKQMAEDAFRNWQGLDKRRGNLILLNGAPAEPLTRAVIQLSDIIPVVLSCEHLNVSATAGHRVPKGSHLLQVFQEVGSRIRIALRSV